MLFFSAQHRLFIGLWMLMLVINIPVFFFLYYRYAQRTNPIIKNKLHHTLRDGYELGEFLLNQIRQDVQQRAAALHYNSTVLDFQRKYFSQSLGQDGYLRFLDSEALRLSGLDAAIMATDESETLFAWYRLSQAKIESLIRDSMKIHSASEVAQTRYFETEQILISRRPVIFTNQQTGRLTVAKAVPPGIAEPYLRLKTAYFYLSDIEQRDQKAIERRTADLYFLFGFFFLAQTLLVWFFSWRFTRPLRRLASETAMLADQREDFRLAGTKRADETGMIARSIEKICENAALQQQRMLDLEKSSLWREIAQRLAHEIKNPLTPIQLTLQQIKDSYEKKDPAFQNILHDCYQIIHEELNRLSVLTREFSEFARQPDFHFRPSSLNKIILDVKSLYQHASIDLKLDAGLPEVFLDAEAIRRVLMNLLDNAIAAAVPDRPNRITISTRKDDERVILTLNDRGRGIPKEHIAKIFEPHFSTKTANMGLGLAIVKSILDKHQTVIDVESVERAGTTFTIYFKLINPLFTGGQT